MTIDLATPPAIIEFAKDNLLEIKEFFSKN